MSASASYYEILQLRPEDDLTPDTVKQAYHHALLLHHPDKARQVTSTQSSLAISKPPQPISIDQIVQAYTVLSDHDQRKAYNIQLKSTNASLHASAHSGIESYDLDDLTYTEHEGMGIWSLSCRYDSGDGDGYFVTEKDLERAASEDGDDNGGLKELLVGCRGCSLFIRVIFAVAPDSEA
jgi:DnaJ-class molecular chaperone